MSERREQSNTEQNGGGLADADQAFLFSEAETTRHATRNPMVLQPSDAGWRLVQGFTLGVQHVMPVDKDPEAVLRAICADAYYVWDSSRLPELSGTGQ